MAVLHIKSTGNKNSGVSLPDNWADDNCYSIASWTTAVTASSAGDTIIFNDETFTASALSLNGADTGALTISSRSGGTVLKTADATTMIFNHGSATAHTFTFENLIVDASTATWTATGTPLIQITQNCTAVAFTGCSWRNITAVSGARTVPLLVRYLPNIGGAAGAMTVTNCTIENVTVTLSGASDSLFKIQDNGANSVANSLTVDGLTLTKVNVTCSAGDNLGIIAHTNASNCTLNNVTMTDITMSGPTGQNVAGLLRQSGTVGTLTASDITIDGFEMTGNASTEAVFKIIGTGTVSDFDVTNLRRSGRESGAGGNSTGGFVLSTGSGASVTVSDGTVRGGGGFFGTAFYNSNSGDLFAYRVTAESIDDNAQLDASGVNPVNGLAFYSGGDGDATWEGCLAKNCSGDTTIGTAGYAHLASTGSTSKTFEVLGCTFTGNNNGLGPALTIKSFLALQTLTVTITNTIFDNGSQEVAFDEDAGTINATFTTTTNHMTEGTDGISSNIAVGTLTQGTPSTGDPDLDPATNLPGLASLHTAGTRYWTATGRRPADVTGEPYPDTGITVGAVQNKSTSFHPTQL